MKGQNVKRLRSLFIPRQTQLFTPFFSHFPHFLLHALSLSPFAWQQSHEITRAIPSFISLALLLFSRKLKKQEENKKLVENLCLCFLVRIKKQNNDRTINLSSPYIWPCNSALRSPGSTGNRVAGAAAVTVAGKIANGKENHFRGMITFLGDFQETKCMPLSLLICTRGY